MDNQFENDFTNAQPRRPFNEKEEPVVSPEQNPAAGFQPEKPLMHNPEPANFEPVNPVQPEADRTQAAPQPQQWQAQQWQPQQAQPQQSGSNQGFNPIEHTATYSGNRFIDRQYQPNQAPNNGYPPYQNPNADFNNRPPYPPQSPSQGYGYRQQNELSNNMYGGAQQAPAPKNKTNKGLVFVIITLSVLLAASIGGIIFFMFSRGGDAGTRSGNRNSTIDFSLPNGFDYTIPQSETTPQSEHKESDYSDKTDKNYKGLSLSPLPSDKDSSKYNSEYAYAQVSESVVGIECFLDDETKAVSQGSGTIISADGFIVTNAHVIGNSKTMYSIKVIDSAGKSYKAGVVGFDTRTDLAVLKLDGASNLKAAQFGDSETLKVGESIFIVGNPGGIEFKNTLTKGIVSALNRDASSKSIVKFIQTDAAINPGNSGGPAVNVYGQVIGIASAKIVDEKYEGMAFCIPSATAKTIVDNLIKNGYIEGRVKIGISGYAVSSAEAAQYGVPTGIMADTVTPDGPCAKAGVKKGEIITAFEDKSISSFAEIYNILENYKDGDKVKIKVYNTEEKNEREVEITLQADK